MGKLEQLLKQRCDRWSDHATVYLVLWTQGKVSDHDLERTQSRRRSAVHDYLAFLERKET